jgi:hypothetical protein
MMANAQTEQLMGELLSFAKKMLKEFGEFHPFGGYLNPSGAVVHVGVESSQGGGGAQQQVDAMVQSFKQIASQKRAIAFGVVMDVRLPSPDGTKGDAIEFLLEHKDGYCVEVFMRYEISVGDVEFAETTAQQGHPRFFVSMH